MSRMIIGVDPHKASVTIEVVDQHGMLAVTGRFLAKSTATLLRSRWTLTSITLNPTSPSVANGYTQAMTAIGTYSDGSTQDVTTSVTWGSSDTAVATISNASGSQGLASSASAGSPTRWPTR